MEQGANQLETRGKEDHVTSPSGRQVTLQVGHKHGQSGDDRTTTTTTQAGGQAPSSRSRSIRTMFAFSEYSRRVFVIRVLYKRRAVAAQTARSRCKVLSIQYSTALHINL